VVAIFTALSEPNRFRIFELLRGGERSVNEIGEKLDLSQPLVSKHLRSLKESGLVSVEPRARQRVYALRAKPLREMNDWLSRYRSIWDARFEAIDELLVELQEKKESPRERKKRS